MIKRHLTLSALLIAALAVMAACAARTAAQTPVTDAVRADAVRADAEAYAEAQGIPLDEALRRMTLQGDIGGLQVRLAANEPDTFAGLWIEHDPAYRIIAAFTKGGARTLRRYVKDTPLQDIAVAQEAVWTLKELESAQAATIALLNEIDNGAATGQDVINNCVSVYTADAEALENEIAAAGLALPEAVCIVPVGPYAEPPPLDPVPGLFFPRQDPPEGLLVEMAALLIGELVEDNGCLRVRGEWYDTGVLVIWPYDHTVTVDANGVPEVRDGAGVVVAKVKETVRIGGGEVPQIDAFLSAKIPDACSGPYWIAARGIESTAPSEIPGNPDVAPLLDDLTGQGIVLPEPHESVAHLLYPEPGIAYALGDRGRLYLHQYPSEDVARVRAQSLPHDLANALTVGWVAPPHFYRCGRIIALYLGTDETMLATLSSRCLVVAELE